MSKQNEQPTATWNACTYTPTWAVFVCVYLFVPTFKYITIFLRCYRNTKKCATFQVFTHVCLCVCGWCCWYLLNLLEAFFRHVFILILNRWQQTTFAGHSYATWHIFTYVCIYSSDKWMAIMCVAAMDLRYCLLFIIKVIIVKLFIFMTSFIALSISCHL